MRKDILEIIVCPNCKIPIDVFEDNIHCINCNRNYTNTSGILNFTENKSHINIDHVNEKPIKKIKKLYKLITFSHTFKTRESKNRIPNLLETLPVDCIAVNIGAGNTNYSESIINIDIEISKNIDIIADSRFLPLADNSIDLIISQAVLEHAPDTVKNVSEMYRILKPNGLIYCEVPFMQTYHAHPHDYFRFTHAGIKDIFKNFSIEEEGIAVGPSSAFSLSLRMFLSTLFSFGNKTLFIIVGVVANWLTVPIKYFDYFLEKSKLAPYMASGIYIIAKKRN